MNYAGRGTLWKQAPILAATGAKSPQPEGDGSGCHELGVSTEGGKADAGNVFTNPL